MLDALNSAFGVVFVCGVCVWEQMTGMFALAGYSSCFCLQCVMWQAMTLKWSIPFYTSLLSTRMNQ